MKLALIGYGEMGKLIERLALQKSHEIVRVIDEEAASLSSEKLASELDGADAAIDFSIAAAVLKNVEAANRAGVSLVEGTTGWQNDFDQVRQFVLENEGSFVYGANFSIGVNLFYKIVSQAAELFAKVGGYEAFLEEQHHSRKVDAPSGTALKLRSLVAEHFDGELPVAATRAGDIPGTHRVGFDGTADQVLLEHAARSREGFASGAILAAEWVVGKTGFWEFPDVLDQILASDE